RRGRVGGRRPGDRERDGGRGALRRGGHRGRRRGLPEDRAVPRGPQGHLSAAPKPQRGQSAREGIPHMPIQTIWVYAEAEGGQPTSGSLELLTKARGLGPNVAAVLGGDPADVTGTLGAFGAAKVYATGDLGS